MQQTKTLTDIASILERSRRILIITHISPDGDAIGSLLGLGWLLRSLGKDVTLVDADPVPVELRYLPAADSVVSEVPAGIWDAVIALDASDMQRLGRVFDPADVDAPLIVIDHHITNLRFGTQNYVDPTAAATSQIIVHLADACSIPITLEAATCLLTGMVTDTRGFRTSNVTADVLATSTRLIERGANLAEISERVLDYKPLSAIRLWGAALDEVKLDGQIIWTHVTLVMRATVDASNGGDSGLVSFLLGAPEANISAVFSEKNDGRVEVSLRSRPGFDVSSVALDFGGGGHAQAAGCTIDGPLPVAEELMLAALHRIKRPEG